MSSFRIWVVITLLRGYVAAGLVAAAVLSPPALSVAPVLLLVWHLYLWWRTPRPAVRLLTDFFLYFAIALSLSERLGPGWPLLVSLPVLALVTFDLLEGEAAEAFGRPRFRRSPTRMGLALVILVAAALCLSWILGSAALLYTSIVAAAYLAVMLVLATRELPGKPVTETPVDWRVVAGSRSEMDIRLVSRVHSGRMILRSPSPWLEVSPDAMPLKRH